MASMSYCRFENTSLEFGRCVNDLQELIDSAREPLIRNELISAKILAMSAQHFLKYLVEYVEDKFGDKDVDPIYYCFDDAIDRINEDASVEDGDDD